ncbi:MAG: zinc ribbon domain-containing protein [Lachnospiraceae bacterium]|nr:zinc ribbon domain-containing protein [Lachnospiraceae bacterium]
MFFIMGVNQGRKNIPHHQLVICDRCNQYGRYEVVMTYMYFSLFFLPLFKWKKRYFVKTSCCHSLYQLDPKIGRAIARGMEIEISPKDMILIQRGTGIKQEKTEHKFCIHCGYTTTEEDFDYCPKCGNLLERSGSKRQE